MNKAHYLDLAYQFRKSKLWKKIFENELFAVRLPEHPNQSGDADDTIGYCCLMGRYSEHFALAVYIGAGAFSTFRRIAGKTLNEITDSLTPDQMEAMLSQDCIQCSLEKKDQFSPQELDELRAYCKASGAPFRTPYPQFIRYRPFCMPWEVTDQSDWKAIETALTVLFKMEETMRKSGKAALGLHPIDVTPNSETYASEQLGLFEEPANIAEDVSIPLFSLVDGALKIERIPLPPFTDSTLSPPPRLNDLAVARIARRRKKGMLECEVMRVQTPIDGNPPYIPAVLFAVREDGSLIPPAIGTGPIYDTTEMLNSFLENLSNRYPRTIRVRSEAARVLLTEFCKKAKIQLKVENNLPLIDQAMDEMMDLLNSDEGAKMAEELDEMIAMLDAMPLQQLRMLPDDLLDQMLDAEVLLPTGLVKKLRKVRGR